MDQQPVCCYRHPDRETGIRCTRCNRPICPECMVSAFVGFQCRECAGQASAPHTRPRTVAGGTVAADPFLITKILIGLNIAVFVLELAMGDRLVERLGLYAICGNDITGQHVCIGVAQGPDQWYRVLTSAFVHENSGAPLHIAFNMLSLWWIGAPLERLLGRSRYLALYFVSAIAGSAAVLLLAPDSLTIGASGAIWGLFGATAVFVRRLRYDMRPILFLLALNIVISFTWSGVSWQAHVGGLIGGTLVALGLAYAPRERRDQVQWGTTAAVLVASLAVTAVAVAQVTS
ncbi:rhomboid family intramembrane serine protease [Streptomyces sp. NBC_01476]|uniref:rhomboid family intramembrane serine protease n=1 Tax=Streptomyces sp. NBC_01476 TaxID=2903881 RepID=UPI002E36776E|nr:rhomboid family intramembrane serine protease [Streptomyces sp. NBC_01476]